MLLNSRLKKVINNKLQLPSYIAIGSVGYYLSEASKRDDKPYRKDQYTFNRDDLNRFWLWSSDRAQTFIYAANDTIYIEICPFYDWCNGEPANTYENFLKTYKPYRILTIDKRTAEHWLEQIRVILAKVGENPEEKPIDDPSIKPTFILSPNQVKEIGWENIEPEMQALLIDHGIVTKNGKIKKSK